jgi:LysM repeat protein
MRVSTCIFAFAVSGLMACTPQPTGTPTPAPTSALPTVRPTATPRPTPTTAPVTPLPPGEVAVTPTPIIYIVEVNDTLIPIANKFGISVADILAANGGLDPARLQIGQRIVIPSGASNPLASNISPQQLLPSPTPVPFAIQGVHSVRTAAGSVECLGEIVNASGQALTNVQVLVSLLDANGATLQAQAIFVAREIVPDGQQSPFRALFTAPPSDFAKVTVLPLRSEPAALDRFAVLTVNTSEGAPNGAQFTVRGELANRGDAAVGGIRVVVTAYDAERRVIGYRIVPVEGVQLEPNASSPFEATLVTASREIAAYGIFADGRR